MQNPLAEPASERAQRPLRLEPDDPLMTADEVALLLRVTKAWVYTQTRAHRIPHVSLGRYVRYRRSAVLHWLDEIEQDPVGSARW